MMMNIRFTMLVIGLALYFSPAGGQAAANDEVLMSNPGGDASRVANWSEERRAAARPMPLIRIQRSSTATLGGTAPWVYTSYGVFPEHDNVDGQHLVERPSLPGQVSQLAFQKTYTTHSDGFLVQSRGLLHHHPRVVNPKDGARSQASADGLDGDSWPRADFQHTVCWLDAQQIHRPKIALDI